MASSSSGGLLLPSPLFPRSNFPEFQASQASQSSSSTLVARPDSSCLASKTSLNAFSLPPFPINFSSHAFVTAEMQFLLRNSDPCSIGYNFFYPQKINHQNVLLDAVGNMIQFTQRFSDIEDVTAIPTSSWSEDEPSFLLINSSDESEFSSESSIQFNISSTISCTCHTSSSEARVHKRVNNRYSKTIQKVIHARISDWQCRRRMWNYEKIQDKYSCSYENSLPRGVPSNILPSNVFLDRSQTLSSKQSHDSNCLSSCHPLLSHNRKKPYDASYSIENGGSKRKRSEGYADSNRFKIDTSLTYPLPSNFQFRPSNGEAVVNRSQSPQRLTPAHTSGSRCPACRVFDELTHTDQNTTLSCKQASIINPISSQHHSSSSIVCKNTLSFLHHRDPEFLSVPPLLSFPVCSNCGDPSVNKLHQQEVFDRLDHYQHPRNHSLSSSSYITAGVSSSSPNGNGVRGDKDAWSSNDPLGSNNGTMGYLGGSGGGVNDGGLGGSGDSPPPGGNGGGDQNNSNPNDNYNGPPTGNRRPRSPGNSSDQPVVIEFAVKNFWKVAKQQNDIESSEIGHCRGFYYRLLIHPKGTTGTDSEASHLSVFLEAVRQPWFPEDWVFPNVRFELTVVNFRDPKQNVTSWAHWSFSNDATSRGWQKMLSHSRLNRLSGFMDEDGTVLIRGKAEPPYIMLWSRVTRYRPHHLWALMPSSTNATTSSSSSAAGMFGGSPNHSESNRSGNNNASSLLWRESQSVLQICDQIVPSIKVALHADYVACFVLILYHLKEFRREIFLWNTSLNPCNITANAGVNGSSSSPPSTGLSDGHNHNQICGDNDGKTKDHHCDHTVVEALQSMFAEMQLWPLIATANQLSLEPSTSHAPNKADVPDSLEWLRRQLASAAPGFSRNRPSSGGVFQPSPCRGPSSVQQPGVKSIMKALCLHDVQKMDVVDPLPRIHTELFTMIHRECQIAYVSHVYKQALLDAKKQHGSSQSAVDDRLDDTCDAQELDHALRVLFSTVPCGSPREPLSSGDYATSFLRAKHVHSMFRALEQSGRKLKRFPEVLFVYLTPQRNTKKGELFDVPLRLEVSSLLENGDGVKNEDDPKKSNLHNHNFHKDEKILKREREKQKRRLRKKQSRTRARRNGGNDDGEDEPIHDQHDNDDVPSGGASARESLIDDANPPSQSNHLSSRLDKWYSLYAVIIREGDSAGTGGGSQTAHTLLLRPEEDGPWFRFAHNRVEKLYPKVDFSEWKCHRDFFCTAAVYVSEDYIDAIANGDIDLEGDLRDLNPELYERALLSLNASEEHVFRRLKAGYELSVAPPPVTSAATTEMTPRKSHHTDMFPTNTRNNSRKGWKTEKLMNASAKEPDQWSHLKFEPKIVQAEATVAQQRSISPPFPSPASILSPSIDRHPLFPFPVLPDRRFLSSGGSSHSGTLFWSSLFTPSRICNGALTSFRDCLILHHHIYQHRLTECLQLGSRIETKRTLRELIADRLALTCYDPTTAIRKKSFRNRSAKDDDCQNVSPFDGDVQPIRLFRSLSMAALPCSPSNVSMCCATVMPFAPLPPSSSSFGHKSSLQMLAASDLPKNDALTLQKSSSNLFMTRTSKGIKTKSMDDLLNGSRKRTLSEDNLVKSCGERLSKRLLSSMSELEDVMDHLTSLLFEIQQDVNLYCLAHRGKIQNNTMGGMLQHPHRNGICSDPPSSGVILEDLVATENCKLDAFVDEWLERIWSTASNLVVEAQRSIKQCDSRAEEFDIDCLDLSLASRRQLHSDCYHHCCTKTKMQHSSKATLNRIPDKSAESEETNRKSDSSFSFYSNKSGLSSWDTSSLLFPRLSVADIVCSAVAAAIEARSAAEWLLLSAGGSEVYPSGKPGDETSTLPLLPPMESIVLSADGFTGPLELAPPTRSRRLIGSMRSSPMRARAVLSRPSTEITSQRSRDTTMYSSQGKRRRSESSRRDGGEDRRYYDYDVSVDTAKSVTSASVAVMSSAGSAARQPSESVALPLRQAELLKGGKKKDQPSQTASQSTFSTEGFYKGLRKMLNSLSVDQDFAFFVDADDFLSSQQADEFQRATVASFGTTGGPAPLLLPYMLSQPGATDSAALRNLRSLDSVLGSVGVVSGLQQLVNTPRFIRISINVEPDLVGLEGFACEQDPPVTRVLTARSTTSVSTLYGLMRLFIHRTCHKKWDNCPPVDSLASTNWSSSNTWKEDGDGVAGSSENVAKKNDTLSNVKSKQQKLVTSWKGTTIDSFMLYALIPDPDPTRKGRHRYVYMSPEEAMEAYCDTKRKLTDPESPDAVVLVMPCPIEASVSPRLTATKKCGGRPSAAALRATTASATTGTRFPRTDDSIYPLLVFKWFDHSSLDLLCMGAQVCDSRKRLEDYIVDWLLPMVRQFRLLPPLCGESSRDDINNYVVVEECHVRACQNVRRFNAAIKKINKRTGDVIIVQLKKDLTSPTTAIERLGTEVLRKLSQNTFMHAASSPFDASWNRFTFEGDFGPSLRDADAVLLAAAALATSDNSPSSGSRDRHPMSSPGGDKRDDSTKANKSGPLDSKKCIEETKKDEGELVPQSGLEQEGEEELKPETKRSKKKKKATVVKTSIPANTKSRIKAQVQEERRREAEQALAKAEDEEKIVEKPPVVEKRLPAAPKSPPLAQPTTALKTKTHPKGKVAWRDSASKPVLLQHEEPATRTKEIAKAKQKKENAVEVQTTVLKSSLENLVMNSKKLTESSTRTDLPSIEGLRKVETQKGSADSIETTIRKKETQDVQLLTHSVAANRLESTSGKSEEAAIILKQVAPELPEPRPTTPDMVLPHVVSTPTLWQRELRPVNANEKRFPVAAEAVLGTFPDGLALVMRRHLRFESEESQIPGVLSPSSSSTGGLESLKVMLDSSCNVTSFVFEVIVASLEEIESVHLVLRVGCNTSNHQSTGTSSRKTAVLGGGDSRVSRQALSVSYHIERLFNDYLRDDRQNQQEIVKEFRKQLDALITAPVQLIDLQQSQNETGKTRTTAQEEDDDVFESEADLFERALSSRQLAALELFAALFIASDLIGTRKGLHSLTMCLLGDNVSSVGSASTMRKLGSGLKTLHQSGADSNATNSAVQQCSALCSLCFLFFSLGAKQVVKLADSQAGRRYFDTVMKKLSDWLRRLSMVAFTESDTSNIPASTRRHQLLLRHSYWALVLVLKDIVAGRTPVVATIVARETEAALSLASLPFRAGGRASSPERSASQGVDKFKAATAVTRDRTCAALAVAGARSGRGTLAAEGRRKASWAAMVQSFTDQEKMVEGKLGDEEEESDEYRQLDTPHPNQDESDGSELFDEDDVESENDEYDEDEDYDDDEDIAVPVRHHRPHSKQSQLTWNYGGPPPKQSIISIAAAVAASPGKHFITGSSMLTTSNLSGWKEKDYDGLAVEKAFHLYNRTEDRLTEMRLFLDRRTGRPRVSKDKPRVVHDSRTWFVTYKPAFWHCSGPTHCVDRPLDLHRLKQGDIERTLRNISNTELQHSGKMESFHLWLMKQFPTQETIRRWTELECGLCHRIDLETSGAVLIARTRRTRDFLWDQFRRRNVHKEYLLLCHGRIKNRFGVVKTRLLTKDYDSRSRIKSHFTQVVQEGGEDSLTEYHLCRVYRRKKWTDIVKSLLETPPKVGEYVLPPDPDEGVDTDGSVTSQSKADPNGEGRHNKHHGGARSRSESPSSPGNQDSSVHRNHSGTGMHRGRMWVDPGLNGKLTEDEEFSLCKCRIVTGRTHQIRVHMRHIGHPLVSDSKYLEPTKCQEDRQWCPRMFLHAAVLEFADPDNPHTFVEAVCPLARELVKALDNALICVDDYEPTSMRQYGIPDVKKSDEGDTFGALGATRIVTPQCNEDVTLQQQKGGASGSSRRSGCKSTSRVGAFVKKSEEAPEDNDNIVVKASSLLRDEVSREKKQLDQACSKIEKQTAISMTNSLPFSKESAVPAEQSQADYTPVVVNSTNPDESFSSVLIVSPESVTSSAFGGYHLSASLTRSRQTEDDNDRKSSSVPSFPVSPEPQPKRQSIESLSSSISEMTSKKFSTREDAKTSKELNVLAPRERRLSSSSTIQLYDNNINNNTFKKSRRVQVASESICLSGDEASVNLGEYEATNEFLKGDSTYTEKLKRHCPQPPLLRSSNDQPTQESSASVTTRQSQHDEFWSSWSDVPEGSPNQLSLAVTRNLEHPPPKSTTQPPPGLAPLGDIGHYRYRLEVGGTEWGTSVIGADRLHHSKSDNDDEIYSDSHLPEPKISQPLNVEPPYGRLRDLGQNTTREFNFDARSDESHPSLHFQQNEYLPNGLLANDLRHRSSITPARRDLQHVLSDGADLPPPGVEFPGGPPPINAPAPISFPNLNPPPITYHDRLFSDHMRIRYEADPLQVHPSLRSLMSSSDSSQPAPSFINDRPYPTFEGKHSGRDFTSSYHHPLPTDLCSERVQRFPSPEPSAGALTRDLPEHHIGFDHTRQFSQAQHLSLEERLAQRSEHTSVSSLMLQPFPLHGHLRESIPQAGRHSGLMPSNNDSHEVRFLSRERPRRFSGSEIPSLPSITRLASAPSVPPGFEQSNLTSSSKNNDYSNFSDNLSVHMKHNTSYPSLVDRGGCDITSFGYTHQLRNNQVTKNEYLDRRLSLTGHHYESLPADPMLLLGHWDRSLSPDRRTTEHRPPPPSVSLPIPAQREPRGRSPNHRQQHDSDNSFSRLDETEGATSSINNRSRQLPHRPSYQQDVQMDSVYDRRFTRDPYFEASVPSAYKVDPSEDLIMSVCSPNAANLK